MKTAALALLLTACVTGMDEPDVTATDFAGTSGGFGFLCVADTTKIVTPCYGDNDAPGVCALGICRQDCTSALGGCPKHESAVFGVADTCWCEPKLKPWEEGGVVPVMEEH